MDKKLDLLKYFPVTSSATAEKTALVAKTPLTDTPVSDSPPSLAAASCIYSYDDSLWAESRSGREILKNLWSTKNTGVWKVLLSISSIAELEVLSKNEIANELLEAVDGISLNEDICHSSPEQCIAVQQQLRHSHPALVWQIPQQYAQLFHRTFSTDSNLITRIWAPQSTTELPPEAPVELSDSPLSVSSREFSRINAPTPSAEIAFLLNLGLSRLQQCEAAGWNEVSPLPVYFEICTTPDIFAQVAKLRAFSILWQLVIQELELHPTNVPTYLMAYSTDRTAHVEPHKALLGSICQSIGAIMGGATHVIVGGSDDSSPKAIVRSLRLARNIQLITRYESKIGDIIDPVGGSWYAENLTMTLMTSAWEIFQTSQGIQVP